MDPFDFDLQDAIVDDYLMSIGMILPPPPAAQGSAFESYQRRAATSLLPESSSLMGGRQRNSGVGANVHRRMFGYLMRRIGHDAAAAAASTGAMAGAHPAPADDRPVAPHQAPRSTRFQHIMRERLRRERLSQGFADLHVLLPPGSAPKGGKNGIVAAAAGYIREMEGRKERLRARNKELLEQGATASARSGGDMVVKVRAEGEHHSMAVDAFETVLRRLKAMEELRVTAIRSCFCGGGMWMDVGVEGEVSSCEVDKAITNALMELKENELVMEDPGSSKPSFMCEVESGVLMD